MAYLKIGDLDMLPYLESGGIKWGSAVVIGETVTTMDGAEHFDVLARKRTLDLSFPPLASTFVQEILEVIQDKIVAVETDIDPYFGHALYMMHCDSQSSTCTFIYENGIVKWSDFEFSLKEM